MIFVFSDESCRLRVRQAAERWNADPVTVAALIMQESAGNSWAWRPEPSYRWLWDVVKNAPFRKVTPEELARRTAPHDFPCLAGGNANEWIAQQSSYGLLQLMGANAREMGFRGPYLTELFDPDVNLEWGTRFFSKLVAKYAAGAISAYNAGTPHPGSEYETSVLHWREELKPLFA
jgi:hypothetical protein